MTETEKKILNVEATVYENKLFFRMAGATAELADGRKITVESNLTGSGVLVTIYTADHKNWRTYHLSAEALGKAVLEGERPATMRCKAHKPNGERIDGCGWQGEGQGSCPACKLGTLVPVG